MAALKEREKRPCKKAVTGVCQRSVCVERLYREALCEKRTHWPQVGSTRWGTHGGCRHSCKACDPRHGAVAGGLKKKHQHQWTSSMMFPRAWAVECSAEVGQCALRELQPPAETHLGRKP
eukprot:1203340-Amphidinium_carterae.1